MSKHKRSVSKRAVSGQPEIAVTHDKSPYVYQRDKLKTPLTIRQRYQFTSKQKDFVQRALDKDTRMILCDGIWGSSKTYNAVYCSLELLSQQKVSSIVYLRSPVEAGKGLGFVPGSIEEKINPYAEPFFEKLHELLDEPQIKMLEQDKRIEVIPPGFIRGRSWNCKAIIVDEAANFSREMLELILSRIGPFCKVFVIGSHHQSDTGDPHGFMSVHKAFDDEDSRKEGIFTFSFNEESDILRSSFLRFVMRKLGVLKPVEPLGTGGDWVPNKP